MAIIYSFLDNLSIVRFGVSTGNRNVIVPGIILSAFGGRQHSWRRQFSMGDLMLECGLCFFPKKVFAKKLLGSNLRFSNQIITLPPINDDSILRLPPSMVDEKNKLPPPSIDQLPPTYNDQIVTLPQSIVARQMKLPPTIINEKNAWFYLRAAVEMKGRFEESLIIVAPRRIELLLDD